MMGGLTFEYNRTPFNSHNSAELAKNDFLSIFKMNSYKSCCICTNYYNHQNPPTTYQCFHTICKNCSGKYQVIQKKYVCPICKAKSNKVGLNYALIECFEQTQQQIYNAPNIIIKIVQDNIDMLWSHVDNYKGIQNIQHVIQISTECLNDIITYGGDKSLPLMYYLNSLHQLQLLDSDFNCYGNIDNVALQCVTEQYLPLIANLYTDQYISNIGQNDHNDDDNNDFEKLRKIRKLVDLHDTECTAHIFIKNKPRVFLNLSLSDQLVDYEIAAQLDNVDNQSQIISKLQTYQHMYQGFIKIDIKDAYSSVCWDVLFRACQDDEYNNQLVNKIKAMYSPKIVIINGQQHTINKGIFINQASSRQLFNIIMEQIVQKFVVASGIQQAQIHAYVDDVLICLEYRQLKKAQYILETFERVLNEYKLEFNLEKTGIFIDKQFTYLGYTFLPSCRQLKWTQTELKSKMIVQHHRYINNSICQLCDYCE